MRDTSRMSLEGTMKPRTTRKIASTALSGITLFVKMSTAVNGFMVEWRMSRATISKNIRETMKMPYFDIGLRYAFITIKYFMINPAHVTK